LFELAAAARGIVVLVVLVIVFVVVVIRIGTLVTRAATARTSRTDAAQLMTGLCGGCLLLLHLRLLCELAHQALLMELLQEWIVHAAGEAGREGCLIDLHLLRLLRGLHRVGQNATGRLLQCTLLRRCCRRRGRRMLCLLRLLCLLLLLRFGHQLQLLLKGKGLEGLGIQRLQQRGVDLTTASTLTLLLLRMLLLMLCMLLRCLLQLLLLQGKLLSLLLLHLLLLLLLLLLLQWIRLVVSMLESSKLLRHLVRASALTRVAPAVSDCCCAESRGGLEDRPTKDEGPANSSSSSSRSRRPRTHDDTRTRNKEHKGSTHHAPLSWWRVAWRARSVLPLRA
jgi:hypothetical protein